MTGSFTRMGTTFLEVAGTVTGEVETAPERTRTSFYLKFLPSPTGKGFDGDPLLVHVTRRERTRKQWSVDGEVILRESRFDPVVDLPVREILDIELAERSSFQTGEVVAELSRRLDRTLRSSAIRRHVPCRVGRRQVLSEGAARPRRCRDRRCRRDRARSRVAHSARSGMKVVLADMGRRATRRRRRRPARPRDSTR